jgi:acetyltransferase-like isoleucine patch superfamily enzyme
MDRFIKKVEINMKTILALLIVPFPWFLKRTILNRLMGHSIKKSAYIGLSIIDARSLSLGNNAQIGHFNIIRSMNLISLQDSATIGNLNWISGEASSHISSGHKGKSFLKIGDHSAITNRHYLDCSGGLEIGKYSTFAGVRSTLLTHSIDVNDSSQKLKDIKIGDYCFISSNCIFIGGSNIPNFSIVGAGSILRNNFTEPYFLYSGNPAKPIKNVSADSKYFTRSSGHVE